MTPKLNVGEVEIEAGRDAEANWEAWTTQKSIVASATVTNGNAAPVAFASGDVVRFKLCDLPSGTPLLELKSGRPTTAGSIVTIDALGTDGTTPASGTVVFAHDDTEDFAGQTLYFEMDLVDNGDGKIKQFLRGQVTWLPTMGGDTGT